MKKVENKRRQNKLMEKVKETLTEALLDKQYFFSHLCICAVVGCTPHCLFISFLNGLG